MYKTQHAFCKNSEDNADVQCICNPGKYCESEVNECISNPCLNRGICVDKVNDYECKCPKGYIGKRCETDVNVCTINNSSQFFETTLCYNGGTCVDGPGDIYFCACNPGYSGQRCEYKVRECDSNPCLHGARCEERESDYYCTCSLGSTPLMSLTPVPTITATAISSYYIPEPSPRYEPNITVLPNVTQDLKD
ncbi:unnamed protein product [Oppiella nova]|uniref:EGF-like domain-containing protein n=1 Tax=Oppiella nova TaxID=334625 RepID=A0A7R9QA96_9ACAR|nr:unnamed protein product [Oppiella nova]CAG2161586.1 unnamed protein product [Oppiella nova]